MGKKIIHRTECCCLFANDTREPECLKRYYFVSNVEKGRFETIIVCNEYLRIKVRAYLHLKNSFSSKRQAYLTVLEKEILSEFINVESAPVLKFGFSGNITEQTVKVNICNRPEITRYLSFKEALMLALEKKNHIVEEELIITIKAWLRETGSRYQKYKYRYKKCQQLMDKISKSFREERDRLLYELLLNIYELNIKNYETN